MFTVSRNFNLRPVSVAKFSAKTSRFAPDVPSQEEWEKAKPFRAIPKQSMLFCWERLFKHGPLYQQPVDKWHPYFAMKHGDIIRVPSLFGKSRRVFIYNPADMKKVYTNEGDIPHRGGLDTWLYWRESRPEIFRNFKGLSTQQGEIWRKYRSLIAPIMMEPKRILRYVPKIDQIAKEFVQITKESLDENNETPADYGQYIQRYTLESIAYVGMEKRMNALDPKNSSTDAQKLFELLNEMFVLTYDIEAKPSLWRLITTPKLRKFMKTWDKVIAMIKAEVDAQVLSLERRGLQGKGSILEDLYKINKEVAIIMVMDMLSVGVDTTTGFIKAVLYNLAINPEVQQKLRDEVMQKLPTDSDGLTAENWRSKPYMYRVMKEALRISPVVSGNMRRLPHNLILQGYRIPKGTDIMMPHSMFSHMNSYFPQHDKFVPERFSAKDANSENAQFSDLVPTHNAAYMPFGYGRRTCIGERVAQLESSILIARLVRNFNISWHYDEPPKEYHVVTQFTGNLKFRMEEINK